MSLAKPYIEEGGLVVCSFDLSGTPRALERDPSKRAVTVMTKSGTKPLLTVVDKGITKQFTCKSPAKFWSGMAALVAGIAIGVVLIATGPVGWLILGAIAATAALAAVAYIRAKHVCNSALEASPDWTLPHKATIINKHKAVLYNRSLLNCNQGGILIASLTPDIAAKQIASNNRWEIVSHDVSQLAIGVLTGYTAGISLILQGVNAALTVGIYSYGESRTDLSAEKGAGLSAGIAGFKAWTYDKYAVLIPGSIAKESIGAMAKEWGKGVGAAALGIGIDYLSNKIEENLSEKNKDVLSEEAAKSEVSPTGVYALNYRS
ncbi:hypothetical protein ABIB40_004027 [Pedobacter sp. UYP30]|uniref:hypothetical protein n=1 Tax=Pedobacter sp. UYP30 TaxID=1756400 RepID=UPI003397E55B